MIKVLEATTKSNQPCHPVLQLLAQGLHLRYVFNPIQDGEAKMIRYQFFPCNFYKPRKQPQKLSDFQFESFFHTGKKFQGHTQYQPKVIELEPKPPLKKRFLWLNPCKFEVMITPLTEMLELANFSQLTTSTI